MRRITAMGFLATALCASAALPAAAHHAEAFQENFKGEVLRQIYQGVATITTASVTGNPDFDASILEMAG